MAKKRKTRRRPSYGRTIRRHAAGIAGGKFGPVIAGVLGGLAAQVGAKFLPGYGGVLGLGGVGYYMNNPTLLTMAGVQASALIPIGGLLGGSTYGGGAI